MVILLVIVAIILGGALLICNFMEGMNVFEIGWSGRDYRLGGSLGNNLMALLTLPGAILGLLIGIITFRWTQW